MASSATAAAVSLFLLIILIASSSGVTGNSEPRSEIAGKRETFIHSFTFCGEAGVRLCLFFKMCWCYPSYTHGVRVCLRESKCSPGGTGRKADVHLADRCVRESQERDRGVQVSEGTRVV